MFIPEKGTILFMSATAINIKRVAKAAGLAFCILILIFLIKSYFDGYFHSVSTFKGYIQGFGFFAPAVLFTVQLFQVVIPLLPGFLGCIVGAVLFGPVGGFWINYLGISAGSIIAFFIARRFGSHVVQGLIGEANYHKYLDWTQKKSFLSIFALAILLPLAPDDILCFLAGLTPMSSRKYIFIILIMKPWCILFYSIFFARFL